MKSSICANQSDAPPTGGSVLKEQSNQGDKISKSTVDDAVPYRSRQMGKRFVRHPLCAIVLFSVITGLGHSLLLADWDPFLSADTHYYFGPTLEILNGPRPGFRQLFVKPFFRAARDTHPMSDEAKPVFVCALRLWHIAWKRWLQPQLILPDPRAYAAFVIASCVFTFLSLGVLGWKLGDPWVGIATALVVLWGPWGLSACYFTTYTAFSLSLFCWAMFLLLSKSRFSSFSGGFLVSLSLLSNQSLIACVPALPLLIFWHRSKDGRQRAVNSLTAFCLGIIFPFAVGQVLGATAWVKSLFGDTPIQKPFDILELYLARVRSERLQFLPAYRNSFFLILSCLNSQILTATGAGIFTIFLAAVAKWICKEKISGLMRKLAEPAIQNSLLILLPGLSVLFVIDGRTAIKVSRAYYLALPFMVMGLFLLARRLTQGLPGFVVRSSIGCLLLLGGTEAFLRVRDFYLTFQGVPHALQALANQAGCAAALQQDIYAPFFIRMGAFGSIDSGQPVPDGVNYLVSGPLFSGALEHSTVQMDLFDYLLRNRFHLALVREIPFFSLYPFLVYEDPEATYSLEVQHRFDRETYRESLGTVKIWRVIHSESVP